MRKLTEAIRNWDTPATAVPFRNIPAMGICCVRGSASAGVPQPGGDAADGSRDGPIHRFGILAGSLAP
jgi:hypothetical protein